MSRPDLRDRRKIEPKSGSKSERFFHQYFFECTLKDTLTAKNDGFRHEHPK